MLISIIMPCFNSQDTIESAIKSVIEQSFKNWELIIYDDASSDNTKTILEYYSEIDTRVKVFYNERNVGPGLNRNLAIQRSTGNYITFLDSDDLWHCDKLLIQSKFMDDNQLDFSHHAFKYFYTKNIDFPLYSGKVFKSYKIDRYKYLTKRGFGYCNTFMITHKLKHKIIFNESGQVAEDFEAFFHFFNEGGISYGIDKTLGFVRLSSATRSSNKKKVISYILKFYLFQIKGNSIINFFYFFLYLIDSFQNRLRINKSIMSK